MKSEKIKGGEEKVREKRREKILLGQEIGGMKKIRDGERK